MAILVSILVFCLFLAFQAQGIPPGDAGDLVTAAVTFGVAHPPGYPLYVFLGWVASHIPLLTPSWRVGLLSSIPHAIVVGLLFDIVLRLTKRKSSAFFAAALLSGNYLFVLYSITPEVFAFLDLFFVLLIWMLLRFSVTKKLIYLACASFIFGVSLTHHHMILFIVPAVVFWFWHHRSHFVGITMKKTVGFITLVLLGLIPYTYVPLAASKTSIINWDNAATLSNFLRLITRADYGTFMSGGLIGVYPLQRLLQWKAYMQYVYLDFGLFGLWLTLAGIFSIKHKKPDVGWFLILAFLFCGPLFVFYASFPLMNNFMLATYERFLLPSYIVLAIFSGVGHRWFVDKGTQILGRIASQTPTYVLMYSVISVLMVYPIAIGIKTYARFEGMPQDFTAEHLGEDVLLETPLNSLIVLSRDTTLFTTQYVRYARLYRPDTAVVHGSFIGTNSYAATLTKMFPDLVVPDVEESEYMQTFLVANSRDRTVFANTRYPVPRGWFWVPHGLLFELVPEIRLPDTIEMAKQNELLWNRMHDPKVGILSRYKHLMLSDVLDVYAQSRVEFGKLLLKSSQTSLARTQFEHAINLGGDTQIYDAHLYLGIVLSLSGECESALSAFELARKHALNIPKELVEYEAITYRDCVGDPARAEEKFEEYERLKRGEETPLTP